MKPIKDIERIKARAAFKKNGKIRLSNTHATLEVDCSAACQDDAAQQGTIRISRITEDDHINHKETIHLDLMDYVPSKRRGISINRDKDDHNLYHVHFTPVENTDRTRQLGFIFNRLNPRELDENAPTPLNMFLKNVRWRGEAHFPLQEGFSITAECFDYVEGKVNTGNIFTGNPDAPRIVNMQYLMNFLTMVLRDKDMRFEPCDSNSDVDDNSTQRSVHIIFPTPVTREQVNENLTALHKALEQFVRIFDAQSNTVFNIQPKSKGFRDSQGWQSDDESQGWSL